MKKIAVFMLAVMMVLGTVCSVSGADVVKFTMSYDETQGTLSYGGVEYKNGTSFEIYATDSIAITVTPKEGYSVDAVTVDSDPNAYHSGGVIYLKGDTNATVSVTFKKDIKVIKYTVHYDETQGTVSYGGVEYKNGSSFELYETSSIGVTVTPKEGYSVDTITVDSDPNAYYSDATGAIHLKGDADANITVTFKKLVKITVNYDADMGEVKWGESVIANGETVEGYNADDIEFVITPKEGYTVSKVVYDGEDVTAFVDSNHKLNVNCKKTVLEVSFAPMNKAPGIVTATLMTTENVWHGDEPAAITYLRIEDGTGEYQVKEAGIYLSSADAEKPWILPAYSYYNSESDFSFVTSGFFAIRVFGEGLNNKECSAKAYLKYVQDNNEETIYGEQSSFTITK